MSETKRDDVRIWWGLRGIETLYDSPPPTTRLPRYARNDKGERRQIAIPYRGTGQAIRTRIMRGAGLLQTS